MRYTLGPALASLALCGLLVGACGGGERHSGDSEPETNAPSETVVTLGEHSLDPREIHIPANTDVSIAVVNEGPQAKYFAVYSPWGEVLKLMPQVCGGVGVERAAPYVPGAGLHPLVIIAPGVAPDWTSQEPLNWQPTSVESTQLVVCVERKKIASGFCGPYSGRGVYSSVDKQRLQLSVRLLEARTARQLDVLTLVGPDPSCPVWLHVPVQNGTPQPNQQRHVVGEDPAFSEAQAWLSQYSGAPAQPPEGQSTPDPSRERSAMYIVFSQVYPLGKKSLTVNLAAGTYLYESHQDDESMRGTIVAE